MRQLLKQLDGFTAIRSRKTPDSGERTLFLEKEGADIPFETLSSGEQAFFLLAADLARRLMLSSPGTPLAEAPGIVCIDEIELHLHPAWQKRILRMLMDTFPACQFVVTTHSPQVIGGVEAHHVRLLEPASNGVRTVSQPRATKGRDSNYVLKGILDTPERDDEVSTLFDKFDRLIDDGELEDAGRCWTSSTTPSRENPRVSPSGEPNGIGCVGPKHEGIGEGRRATGAAQLEDRATSQRDRTEL